MKTKFLLYTVGCAVALVLLLAGAKTTLTRIAEWLNPAIDTSPLHREMYITTQDNPLNVGTCILNAQGLWLITRVELANSDALAIQARESLKKNPPHIEINGRQLISKVELPSLGTPRYLVFGRPLTNLSSVTTIPPTQPEKSWRKIL